MDDWLETAIEAHGGLNAWNQFESLRASVSAGGALWDQKQLPGLFNNSRIDLKLRQQQVITHLPDMGERIVFTPNQVSLESDSGTRLDTRIGQRSTFAGQSANSKWDRLHAGYFCCYALWGYLTTPFLYTYPGFEAREIEPWQENGERWRVLEVTFPKQYAAHSRVLYSYFREDGLLRRHWYTVDVSGGAVGANYAFEYREVEGVLLPTNRRVFAYDANRQKAPEPVLISIDLSEIHFE